VHNRREFLKASIGTTTAVAAASVAGACAPEPSTPPPTTAPVPSGYAVGQLLPPIVGANQYGGTSSSADYRGSWVLIDFCPWWCMPCIASARQHAEFLRSVRAAGVDLRILPVVVQDMNERASERNHAEEWTSTFGLSSEIALHCDGDDRSPLLGLVGEFAVANGHPNPVGGYPTYVLVDPSGVIRHYQVSSDLDEVQAALAQLTGTSLTGTWPVLSPAFPSWQNVEVAEVNATGALYDGTPFDHTFQYGADTGSTRIFTAYWDGVAPQLTGYRSALYNYTEFFSPDTPITVTLRAGEAPRATRYTRVTGFNTPIALIPDDAWLPDSIDTSKIVVADGTVTTTADRTELVIPAAAPLLGPGRSASIIALSTTFGATRWSMPYALAKGLLDDVPSFGLPSGAATALTGSLQGVLNHLGGFRLADATATVQQAVDQAVAAEAAFPVIGDLRLLEDLVADAADGI
jgi:peroxiredoxin